MRRLTQAQKERIERMANELYDKLNPKPNVKIHVSKAECLKRVEKQFSK